MKQTNSGADNLLHLDIARIKLHIQLILFALAAMKECHESQTSAARLSLTVLLKQDS